jgi:DNA gyrase subunit A
VTQNGYGKRSALGDYPQQARGGSGVRTIITSDRNGPVVSVRLVSETDELMIATVKGMVIRIPVFESEANQVRVMGRATQGVRLIRLAEGDKVVCVGVLTKAEDEATANGDGDGEPEGAGTDATVGEGGGVTVEAAHVASIASAGPEKDIDEGAGDDDDEGEDKGKEAGGQGASPAA